MVVMGVETDMGCRSVQRGDAVHERAVDAAGRGAGAPQECAAQNQSTAQKRVLTLSISC